MRQRKKVLFICGSMNQTTQMHSIAKAMVAKAMVDDGDCWFTPYYTDGFVARLQERGLIEFTIAGHGHRARAAAYLAEHGLNVDDGGTLHSYDLILTCSDLVVPKNVRGRKVILVQEGMTDPENALFYAAKYLGFPRYLASTSTFGLSHAYVRMCVASVGYRDHFVQKGVAKETIAVTGIPNFDNCQEFANTPFEHQNYVLVATSDARETLKYENRKKFIYHCLDIAAGRTLVFKLHPNENIDRGIREIQKYAPKAHVYHSCPINHMIAHCDVLVTRFSTVVYIGIALGKQVFSEFDLTSLHRMAPIQNGGTSAQNIADVCQEVLDRHDLLIPVVAKLPAYRTYLHRQRAATLSGRTEA